MAIPKFYPNISHRYSLDGRHERPQKRPSVTLEKASSSHISSPFVPVTPAEMLRLASKGTQPESYPFAEPPQRHREHSGAIRRTNTHVRSTPSAHLKILSNLLQHAALRENHSPITRGNGRLTRCDTALTVMNIPSHNRPTRKI